MHPFVLPSMPLKDNLPGHAAALLDREPLLAPSAMSTTFPTTGRTWPACTSRASSLS